ncbi:MAG: ABC transporter permease [Clostridia bacterium]|nr:ABC transporter permease [Clostridia bacterium]
MKNIWTVIKKDLKRYFTDKRILISLFLPGLIIFVMYNFMGNLLAEQFAPSDQICEIYAVNLPEEVKVLLESTHAVKLTDAAGEDPDGIKKDIREKKVALYAVFEENFMESILSYDPQSGTPAPRVKLYFNSTDATSQTAYSLVETALDTIENSIANRFDVNPEGENYDCATVEDVSTTLITMLVPMLLMIFLWSGCMMIASESIAGEKERGTIATLLVTPLKRSHLALGKIIGLSLPALASSACSFLGIILSLPKLFAGMDVSASIYGFGTYAALLALVVVTVLLFNIILVMISTLAKSVKEAASYASVAMVPIMLIGVVSMMGNSFSDPMLFMIPGFNTAQCFAAVLALSFSPLNFLITVVSNAVYVALGIFLLTKMFDSEKIMFGK